jgi:hypothetical protein
MSIRDVHWGLRADETSPQPGVPGISNQPLGTETLSTLSNRRYSQEIPRSLPFTSIFIISILIDGVYCGVPSHPSRSSLDYC